MKEKDYDYAFGPFTCCVPADAKEIYSVPMGLLTPKMALKMAAIPGAVYLAKCDKVLDLVLSKGQNDRGFFKFGDVAFEVTAKPNTLGDGSDILVCFTPYVVNFEGNEYVALRVHGISPTEFGGTDPSDLARDREDLDRAVAHHEATT